MRASVSRRGDSGRKRKANIASRICVQYRDTSARQIELIDEKKKKKKKKKRMISIIYIFIRIFFRMFLSSLSYYSSSSSERMRKERGGRTFLIRVIFIR